MPLANNDFDNHSYTLQLHRLKISSLSTYVQSVLEP